MAWTQALATAVKDEKMRVDEDERTYTIKDGFPKAQHHYLVLPKPVQARGISSLTRDDCPLVQHMTRRGEELVERLTEKDPKLKFRIGFHAIPSMAHLHLHVISQEFDSEKLKNKKHWNSFTTDFFMEADEVVEGLKKDGRFSIDKRHYEELLKQDLTCPCCKTVGSNLPKMREHYRRCFSSGRH